jgi:hypothetical protein
MKRYLSLFLLMILCVQLSSCALLNIPFNLLKSVGSLVENDSNTHGPYHFKPDQREVLESMPAMAVHPADEANTGPVVVQE